MILDASEDGIKAAIEDVDMTYDQTDSEIMAQINNIKNVAEKMAAAGQFFSPDFFAIVSRMQEPEKITDFVFHILI